MTIRDTLDLFAAIVFGAVLGSWVGAVFFRAGWAGVLALGIGAVIALVGSAWIFYGRSDPGLG
jgi:hypothetical protein